MAFKVFAKVILLFRSLTVWDVKIIIKYYYKKACMSSTHVVKGIPIQMSE